MKNENFFPVQNRFLSWDLRTTDLTHTPPPILQVRNPKPRMTRSMNQSQEPAHSWEQPCLGPKFCFVLFNWNIVDLQCCVNFFCTAKWLSYTYIYILFYILFHYVLSREIRYNSLCCTVGPCCLSIPNVIVCIYQPQTPSPTLPLSAPPWQPQVCSLCPWVCFCFVDRIICAIF